MFRPIIVAAGGKIVPSKWEKSVFCLSPRPQIAVSYCYYEKGMMHINQPSTHRVNLLVYGCGQLWFHIWCSACVTVTSAKDAVEPLVPRTGTITRHIIMTGGNVCISCNVIPYMTTGQSPSPPVITWKKSQQHLFEHTSAKKARGRVVYREIRKSMEPSHLRRSYNT